MPRRPRLKPPKRTATILFKSGRVPTSIEELFQRIFWKSRMLAEEAYLFFKEVKKREPEGLPSSEWKRWIKERGMSIGSFYNMIHKLVGAGLIEKKAGRWRISTNFLRELEQMIILYSAESGYEHRLK